MPNRSSEQFPGVCDCSTRRSAGQQRDGCLDASQSDVVVMVVRKLFRSELDSTVTLRRVSKYYAWCSLPLPSSFPVPAPTPVVEPRKAGLGHDHVSHTRISGGLVAESAVSKHAGRTAMDPSCWEKSQLSIRQNDTRVSNSS